MKLIKNIWKFIYKIFPVIFIIIFGIITFIYINKAIEENLDYYSSIISGIISGVVTAIIIFIVQIIWKKNFLVWIENLLYQDVCIEGEWSGILIPYIGLEDLDKMSKDIAWRKIKEMHHKTQFGQKNKTKEKTKEVEATVLNKETGKEEKISAEIVLSNEDDTTPNQNTTENPKKRIDINISPVPIIIKVDIKRIGHQITGKIIEVGGASKVCSYSLSGTFKNLILSACYQTTNKDNIDRGALSLMLFDNGKRLEGFFSSYSDGNHKIAPMQCVLIKKNHINEGNSDE